MKKRSKVTHTNGMSVLTLSTARPPRRDVSFDGAPYELLHREHFGNIREIVTLERLGYQLQTLGSKADRTDEENAELRNALDQVTRLVWKAPDDVQEKLTDIQRLRICAKFMEEPANV